MIWSLALAMGALIAVTLALLLWPLLRNNAGAAPASSSGALNAAVYRDQLAELARDRTAGTLSEEAFLQSAQELQRRALQDTAGSEAQAVAPAKIAPRPKALLASVALAIPVCAALLYLWLGSPRAMLQAEGRPNFTAAQVDDMVSRLAARMEANPNDPKGWIMLARSYKALGRLELAEKAYARIGPLMEQDPELLDDYAVVLAQRASGDFQGKPQELIDKALKLDPDNAQTLELAGIAAFRRQSYSDAADYLDKLLPKLPPESEEAKTVKFTIEKARSLVAIGAPASGAAAGKKSSPAGESASKTQSTAGASLSGLVTLAPALAARVKPDDTLFVFARAANGPRVPLAVLRAKAGAMPLRFTLDDSLSMSPQFRLSTVAAGAEVHVEARISRSGDAMPKSGDLIGDGGNVKPGARNLSIVIDHALP